MRTTKTKFFLIFWLVAFLFGALSSFTATTNAAPAPVYSDVNRDGWNFYYVASKDLIIATTDSYTPLVIFSGKRDGDGKIRYHQEVDRFSQGSASNCIVGAHMDKNGVDGLSNILSRLESTKVVLYEPQGNTCTKNTDSDYEIGDVTVTKEVPEEVLKVAASINYADPLIGCPGEAAGPPLPTANYNCPNGGAVVNGTYDKDASIETPISKSTLDNEAACDNALAPFGWVLCPILNLADTVYSWLVNIVNNLLFFDFGDYNDSALRKSSQLFVNLANVAIVLFALLMIAAQIFSFEVFSAYTVKKVLPRIVIGAILIQLSWPIFTLMIQFVNALGSGLYWLLLAPFGYTGDGLIEIGSILAGTAADGGGEAANALGLAAVGVAVGAGVAVAGGVWLTVVMMAIGVLISLLVALLTLVLREVVLIVLLAIAPLALAFWIFPGTKNYWELWWKSFSKLLLMYPLIMLLFAGGIMAATILKNADGTFGNLFAIIAYFAPIFLIGATYKFAGDAFGAVSGATSKINNRARGSGMLGLKKAAENSKASRDYNRKRRGVEWAGASNSNFAKRRVGRLMAGTAGVSGAHARSVRESEEQEYLKNISLEHATMMKGREFQAQVNSSTAIATARIGSTVSLQDSSGKETGETVKVTEGMQRVSTKFLADTKRSNQLRQVETAMRANGEDGLWNTIVNENAGSITAINPDQVGKKFDTLSAEEMSNMKPETFRNMRAMMADPKVEPERKAKVSAALKELMGTDTLRGKLGADALAHVESMQSSTPTRASVTIEYPDGSKRQHFVDANGVAPFREVRDPATGRITSVEAVSEYAGEDKGWKMKNRDY